jgi:hypothetical protein
VLCLWGKRGAANEIILRLFRSQNSGDEFKLSNAKNRVWPVVLMVFLCFRNLVWFPATQHTNVSVKDTS